MWYNIILLAMLCYAALIPYAVVFCIKFGYKMADNPRREIESKQKKKLKPIELTEEQKKEVQYYENIMRYDGTSRGQVKVGSEK